LILVVVGVVVYAAWQADQHQDASHLSALPIGALLTAGEIAKALPGYAWVALMLVLWL
jgi:hypothetical protein